MRQGPPVCVGDELLSPSHVTDGHTWAAVRVRRLFTHLNGSRHGCAALNFIFNRRKWQEGSKGEGDLYRPLFKPFRNTVDGMCACCAAYLFYGLGRIKTSLVLMMIFIFFLFVDGRGDAGDKYDTCKRHGQLSPTDEMCGRPRLISWPFSFRWPPFLSIFGGA